MDILKYDLGQKGGAFKILNATNGGPLHKRHANDQYRSNLAAYKAARIPYSRNHDSGGDYNHGGPYSHDVSKIFRDFDADANDEASYDFACTDEDILVALDAGTKTYFRLGETIEHHIKKHSTLPPKDFEKWAVICEHIIMHYTEGWANGFHHDMPYWEIWNEPDLDPDDSPNKRTWGGTKAQFFDMYEIAAKHLKKRFPHLKIGGPALANGLDWADDFLYEMHKRNVPIDFFSWHIYCVKPEEIVRRSEKVHSLMEKHGYGNAESILNEWNYIRGWTDEYVYSIETIGGMKGAAFVMSCIAEAQRSTIDMLMYYDTRTGIFNGAFDIYTQRTRKPYWALYWYGMFYDMSNEVRCQTKVDGIYELCGVDEQGRALAVVTYYTDDDAVTEEKEIKVDFGKSGRYEVYLLDEQHDAELICTTDDLSFKMIPNSCILIKEI